MRGGRLLRGPKRRQQLLACLFTSATDLGANTAVLMVIGVPLTLVTAQSARLSARLHDHPRQLRLNLRLPAYDSLCRRTDIAAVLAQADTADQRGDIVLAEIGVGAGRTALGTVRARLDAVSKCTGLHDGARRVRLQHLLRVSHRISFPFFRAPGSRARCPRGNAVVKAVRYGTRFHLRVEGSLRVDAPEKLTCCDHKGPCRMLAP
jgi:hypothetical protein